MSGDLLKHGDSPGISGYRRGCKCAVCRAAKRDYMREWRARRREAEAAAVGEAPLVDREAVEVQERPPLESVPPIDLDGPPGAIEQALDEDLADPAGDVLWVKSYIAMARLNTRILDQVVRHERLDLVPSVMLRQNEILNRLTHLKLRGHLDNPGQPGNADASTAADSSDTVAKEAARMLAELDGGTPV